MPSDLHLRDARPGDEAGVASVHVRSWQAAYRGLLPDACLDSLDPEDRARRYTFDADSPTVPRTIVAAIGPAIVGFATVRLEDPRAAVGELAALYVDPTHWDVRIGAALIVAARRRLMTLGARAAYLWLLEGNQRAERFYRLDGWEPDGRRREESVWGVDVIEIGFRRALVE